MRALEIGFNNESQMIFNLITQNAPPNIIIIISLILLTHFDSESSIDYFKYLLIIKGSFLI